MVIGTKEIGKGHTYIIAELSGNHNQDIELAKQTIIATANTGADAIKLQTYRADTITIDCDNKYFQTKSDGLWAGQTLYQLYQKAFTPWEWHEELMALANSLGLDCFSSPFDPTAVDFLETLNVPAYKIASFEITDIPLIEYVASKQKPVIISTGIANEEDIQLAINACHRQNNKEVIILKCTSAYPTPIASANLSAISTIQKKYGVLSGLSDHTLGSLAPTIAVTLGASVIEKHIILDKSIPGVDKDFSLDIAEFTELVNAVRQVEKALGNGSLAPTQKMIDARTSSRSLFVVDAIQKGETITRQNVKSVRPGYGLHPKFLPSILGKKAKIDLSRGTPLTLEALETNLD